MKGLEKLFMLMMVAALIFTLGGCGKKEKATKTGLEFYKDRGYVTVGFDDTFVPMGFKDDKGEIVGFDVDLAKEVGKRLDLEVKFQPIDWSMKETELKNKNIDFIWNGYTITDERKEKVNFSKPYLENRQVIITLSDSKVNSKADLKGMGVATQNGSSSLEAINAQPDFVASLKGKEPVLFDNYSDALMDLEAKRVDAVVADEIMARYYIAKRGVEKYKVLSDDFGKEEYGVGVRKADNELLDALNENLDAMKTDGACEAISTKWFGENIVK